MGNRFISINLNNGDFAGEISIYNLQYLLSEGYLKKESYPEGDIYIVKREQDLDYLRKFYFID